MRDGQPGRGQSVSQRIRRTRAPASPDPSVPPGGHHRLQCGSHRRPASRRDAHGRHHEPAVFRDAGRRPHPPRRGSAPYSLGIFDAAAGRPIGDDYLGELHPRAMPPGGTPSTPSTAAPAPSSRWPSTAAPMQARHRLRHPAHRARPFVQARNRHRPGGPRRRRRRTARRRHRQCAAQAADYAGGRSVHPGRPGTGPVRQAGQAAGHEGQHRRQFRCHACDRPRLGTCRRARRRDRRPRHRYARIGHAGECRPLRTVAARRRAGAGRHRPSHAAGAVRRHGRGAASRADLPADAARTRGGGRAPVRRATRKRRACGRGPLPPSRRRLPHRCGLGDRAALPGGRRRR